MRSRRSEGADTLPPRRQHPVAVAALVGAATIGLVATGAQDYIPLPDWQPMATYTAAAVAPLWRMVGMADASTAVLLARDLRVTGPWPVFH